MQTLPTFTGSSTTGIAANLLNRHFFGIDMEEQFLQISKASKEEIDTPANARNTLTASKNKPASSRTKTSESSESRRLIMDRNYRFKAKNDRNAYRLSKICDGAIYILTITHKLFPISLALAPK